VIRLVLALCLFACANAREARTPEQTKAEQDAAGTAQEPLPPSTQASNLSPIAKSWLEQVKNAFGNLWTKAVIAASQRTDPTGCIYSTQDRRTVVCFRVADEGDIYQVRVSRSSGVKYLDQVAIESVEGVKKLSPPPPGLVHRELPMAFTLLGTKVKPCPPPPSIDRTSALDETSPVPPTSP